MSDPIEQERLQILEERESLERRFMESEAEELRRQAEARNLFSDKSFLEDAQKPKKLVIPELGGHVLYCPLSYGERLEVTKIKDQDKQNRRALFIMLGKANPEITEDMINNLRADYVDAILMAISKETNSFLLPIISDVLSGFSRTLKPRS